MQCASRPLELEIQRSRAVSAPSRGSSASRRCLQAARSSSAFQRDSTSASSGSTSSVEASSSTSSLASTTTGAATTSSGSPGAVDWVEAFGSAAVDSCLDVSSVDDGTTYVAGCESTDLSNDAGLFCGTTAIGTVRHLDPDGGVIDVLNFGTGNNGGFAYGRKALQRGNSLLIGGVFQGALDVGAKHVQAGDRDAFLAGYQAAMTDTPTPQSLAVFGNDAGLQQLAGLVPDSDGGVLLAGSYDADFAVGSFVLLASGVSSFVAHLDASGTTTWATPLSATGPKKQVNIHSAAPDGAGGVVIGGILMGTLNENGVVLIGDDLGDGFVLDLDATGAVRWGFQIGSKGAQDSVGAVAVDASGDVYVVGQIGGPTTVDGKMMGGAGGEDIFFVKLDSAGQAKLAQSFGGPKDDVASAVAVAQTTTSIWRARSAARRSSAARC